MSHIALKKQEEQNNQKLKELLRRPENKKCFDCPVKSPFFVNASIQTFVCARCSGLVREVGHRVKSISASKFSGPELLSLDLGGNKVAEAIWLSTYHANTPEPETDSDVRYFMRQKYYEQKWLDRKRAVSHAEEIKVAIKEAFSEDGSPRKQERRKQSVEIRLPVATQQQWVDDNTPIGLISTVNSQKKNKSEDLLLDDDIIPSPKSPTPGISFYSSTNNNNNNNINPLSPIMPFGSPQKNTPTTVNKSPTSDIYADLVGLVPTPSPMRKASYSGGILQPNSPTSNGSSTTILQQPLKVNTRNTIPTPQPSANSTPSSTKLMDLDPYAALRGLSLNESPQNTSLNMNMARQQGTSSPSASSSFTKSSLFSELDPLSQFK
ncbi:Arf GTPase activating protein [Backusella circina FSU 941]|nr:Arf GTPase activating protein [Backusella circina FSU 941]